MLTYRWYACSAEMKNATQRCRMQQTNKKEQTSTGGYPLDVRTFGTHFRSISGDHDLDKSQKNHKRNKQKNTGNDKHMQQLAPFSEHSRRRRPVPPGFPKLQRSESPFGRQSIHNFSVQSTTMLFVSNHSSALDPRSTPSIQVLVQHIIAVPYKKRL